MRCAHSALFVLTLLASVPASAQIQFGGSTQFASHPACSSLEVADLDGDGLADVLYRCQASGTVGWLRSLGGGSFAASIAVGGQSLTAHAAAPADVDGDGTLDEIASSLTPAAVV
jgi:Tfp pilus tip-associated adhesin PilY1